jgi:hypothetical protein
MLPSVSNVIVLPVGAFQLYQMDRAAGSPAISGSPVSTVAPVFTPVAVPLKPTMAWALVKLSLAGCARTEVAKMHAATAKQVLKGREVSSLCITRTRQKAVIEFMG